MGFFTKLKSKLASSVAAKVATGVAIVALLGCGTVGIAYASGLAGVKTAVGVALINTFVTDSSKLFKEVQEQGGEATFMRVVSDFDGPAHNRRYNYAEYALSNGVRAFCATVLDVLGK